MAWIAAWVALALYVAYVFGKAAAEMRAAAPYEPNDNESTENPPHQSLQT